MKLELLQEQSVWVLRWSFLVGPGEDISAAIKKLLERNRDLLHCELEYKGSWVKDNVQTVLFDYIGIFTPTQARVLDSAMALADWLGLELEL